MTVALLLNPRTTLALVDALDRTFSAAVVLTVLLTAVSPLVLLLEELLLLAVVT